MMLVIAPVKRKPILLRMMMGKQQDIAKAIPLANSKAKKKPIKNHITKDMRPAKKMGTIVATLPVNRRFSLILLPLLLKQQVQHLELLIATQFMLPKLVQNIIAQAALIFVKAVWLWIYQKHENTIHHVAVVTLRLKF